MSAQSHFEKIIRYFDAMLIQPAKQTNNLIIIVPRSSSRYFLTIPRSQRPMFNKINPRLMKTVRESVGYNTVKMIFFFVLFLSALPRGLLFYNNNDDDDNHFFTVHSDYTGFESCGQDGWSCEGTEVIYTCTTKKRNTIYDSTNFFPIPKKVKWY